MAKKIDMKTLKSKRIYTGWKYNSFSKEKAVGLCSTPKNIP